MDDEARATGLGPVPDREPRNGPGGAGGRPIGIRASDRGGGGAGGMDLSGPTYAALDLGTNNCRLLVARATRDGFRVVDAFSRIIRLGEGDHHVRPAERGRDRARRRGAARLPRQDAQPRRHAGAADRDRSLPRGRSNGIDFLERVRERGRHRRSRSSIARPRRGLPPPAARRWSIRQAKGVILFDIGGGSSELVRLGPSRADAGTARRTRKSSAWISIPIGVVTLAERHGGVTVSREIFERMIAEVADLRRSGSPPSTAAPRHAHARHLGHRDHHRRRLSRSAALRAPPRRWLLDERRPGDRRGRAAACHELRRPRRQSLHRRRARRPGAGRLRDPRSDPPRVSVSAAARRRPRACARACWCR